MNTATATLIHMALVSHNTTRSNGRTYRFETHPYWGPTLLRKDGTPYAKQPGEKHPFWPAFSKWEKRSLGEPVT